MTSDVRGPSTIAAAAAEPSGAPVLTLANIARAELAALLARYRLRLEAVPDGDEIPGSFWGESEAGLIADRVLARSDTPVHSILHEACHAICMSPERRAALHTDAGGGYDEEDAVCYLQILLADEIAGMGRRRMAADMDAWGYTFRLGSAAAWFDRDAEDAAAWLTRRGLIDPSGRPTFRLREGD